MNIKSLYSPEQIQEAVKRVARDVEQFFGSDEPVVALCLLNGAIWYAADLLRCLPVNFELQTIRISSYEGTESTGKLKWHNALPDCAGKQVLVIDDVLDTGLTMKAVCDALQANGATKVASAVAINKKGRRNVAYEADFCALHCDDFFLVGYGLDFNGKYRNLPFIGYIEA
ncbi:MAG: phosphoribosyltransferase family protein [Akkermansia sp.]|nr:phosphoribosyltransferase family protein [Akkermansia sp.]